MALGGGVFVTQNKVLAGSYINFVQASKSTATLGERGVCAIALPLGNDTQGSVITVTRSEFLKDSQTLLGYGYGDELMLPLREIFANASKCYVYNLGIDDTTTNDDSAYDDDLDSMSAFLSAVEPYDFNTIVAWTDVTLDITAFRTMIHSWRDEMGKKCQGIVYNQTNPNDEGIVNVCTTVEGTGENGYPTYALVAWVAGALAGCQVNKSCTNMLYNGELVPIINLTQTQLESAINGGKFVFHNVYGDCRVLEDINSLTQTTAEKGDDFKSNQTIRVIDQIANDIAKLFNTKYLGQIPNNKSGRLSLWGDIVSHHKQLEGIEAIQEFDPNNVVVSEGNTKKSVVVNDVINVVNAMAQLYMTVIVG